jgi:hypothetical protein
MPAVRQIYPALISLPGFQSPKLIGLHASKHGTISRGGSHPGGTALFSRFEVAYLAPSLNAYTDPSAGGRPSPRIESFLVVMCGKTIS